MPFVKPEKKREGVKFLIYGESGSGKTPTGLSFPNQAFIDSDSGANFYDDDNILVTTSTLSFKELNEDLDDLEMEEELFEQIETFTVDSITRFYENLQHAMNKVAERRALRKGRAAEEEGMSFREHGKMKLYYDEFFARLLGYSKQGKNLVFIAEQKDKNENIGGDIRKVGVMPNMPKDSEFDFDVVIRTFNEKGQPKGEIIKDRTGTFKVGEVVDRPNYELWKDAIEKAQKGKKRDKSEIKSYSEVLDKEMEELDEAGDLLKDKIMEKIKELTKQDGMQEKIMQALEDGVGTYKIRELTDKKKLKKALDIVEGLKAE
jgi:hypothetical protein